MNKPAYEGDYFSIFLDPNDVEYVRTGDSALIVAVTPGSAAILSHEPAPAFDNETALVVPGGEVDLGETALETANRELQEEIGFRAGRLDFIGEIRPFAKYLQSRQFVFLARDLQASHLQGDENYKITTEEIPLVEVESWVAAGRLKDAGTIAALFLVRSFLGQAEKS